MLGAVVDAQLSLKSSFESPSTRDAAVSKEYTADVLKKYTAHSTGMCIRALFFHTLVGYEPKITHRHSDFNSCSAPEKVVFRF